MVGLVIFILAALGMTNIIVREGIFLKQREWLDKTFPRSFVNKAIQCPTCAGFWVGLILSLIFPTLGINWFMGGLISSISNKIVWILLYKF